MKKPHIFKQLHKENKGISLVEIIVSLLILMIIIVPMLSSFVTASKTNQSAKASSYAKSAAENVVEMVKLLGLEKTALEFHKSVTTDFQLINGCSNFEEVVLPGEYPSVISGAFVKKTSGEYEYNITGITEGTETYDIKLKLSDVQYSGSGGPNEYQYADLSAFNSKTTAVINPVLSNSTYDYRVFQYFKSMHERYKYGIYSAERDRIDSINSAIMEQYYIDVDAANSTGRPAPPLPSTLPIPTQEPYNQDDAIRNTIKKTIDISLEEVAG